MRRAHLLHVDKEHLAWLLPEALSHVGWNRTRWTGSIWWHLLSTWKTPLLLSLSLGMAGRSVESPRPEAFQVDSSGYKSIQAPSPKRARLQLVFSMVVQPQPAQRLADCTWLPQGTNLPMTQSLYTLNARPCV